MMSNNIFGFDKTSITKTSTDCLFNLIHLNLLSNNTSIPTSITKSSGLSNGSNTLLNADNVFFHSTGGGGGGGGGCIGGGLTDAGNVAGGMGNVVGRTIGGGSGGGVPTKSTGRAIVNTGNIVANNTVTTASDIFSGNNHRTDRGGRINLADFKNGYKTAAGLLDGNIVGSQHKQFLNGDGAFSDFGEFMARDPFFNTIHSPNGRTNNNATNTGFPPIGTFTIESATTQSNQIFNQPDFFSSSSASTTGINNTNGNIAAFNGNVPGNGDVNQATRETGIIEKLLHSYGFIQCCERQARLFFHFSQFSGNIEHLKIGDPVEFEMTYDRRTGKPIASQVTKIAPEVVLSEERVTGTVTTELRSDNSTTSTGGETTTGRISYENRGECFFLPYTKDDVEGHVTLCAGDKVSFQIATNQRGNLGACHIRLENPVHPVKYRGVVCSMKESFGFIERADVVKEIFFHFSEAEGSVELRPGDDVEFIIQTRNGKEVACNIARLPPGSVVFEDIGTVMFKGQVLKPLERTNPLRHNNDPLPGRIRYRALDHSEVEVPFGDKDQRGDFTLRHGDWVQFYLATDRRDQLQRATSISLLEETFEVSGEKREQGVVSALKEGYGFLRCVERSARLFFHVTEVLDTSREISLSDEVEFTAIQEPGASFANSRQCAIRIKHLQKGTVQFETPVENNIEGIVTREAPVSAVKSQERMEGGVITYTQENVSKSIVYFLNDCDIAPRANDRVKFDICQVKRNKELIAINLTLMHNNVIQSQSTIAITSVNNIVDNSNSLNQHGNEHMSNAYSTDDGLTMNSNRTIVSTPLSGIKNDNNGGKFTVHQGFLAVLKENFGFIETLNHDEEVFFHFSTCLGEKTKFLELGQEVEYTLSKRNGSNAGNCLPAENVKILPKGTITQPIVLDTIYNGIVSRPLRCINPNQQQYAGLIESINEDGDVLSAHEFGITSLTNKRDLLQKDDHVIFKIDETNRAAEVTAVRQKKRANVDSIKGLFGFLDYEVEEGKKLFFHMTEVQGNSTNLYQGDLVEFSIVTNQRNGKSSACNLIKVTDNVSIRPERLLSRLKVNSIDESIPRLIVIRQPKGPDGVGFSNSARMNRLPGILLE